MKLTVGITAMAVTLSSIAAFAFDREVEMDSKQHSSASASQLDGEYALDFYASSGNCLEKLFVKTTQSNLTTNARPGGPDEFFFGDFCQDRTFPGDPVPSPEKCSDQVWSSKLSADKNTFEFFTYYSRIVSGNSTKVPLTRLTLSLVSKNRVQADLLSYDGHGTAKPILRCVFQK